jgi:hypothetical protein
MIGRHQTWSAGSLKLVAEALRSYIQFRATFGDAVQHLTFAVPNVANRAWYARPSSLHSGVVVGPTAMSTYSGTVRPAGFWRRALR